MGKVNLPMRTILKLPIATPLSARLMLVSYVGRRSGKRYEQPVSYVRDGDVLLTPGGGRWKSNLRDGQAVRLRMRGHDIVARPTIVSDVDEVGRSLRVMAAKNPTVGAFVGIRRDADGTFDRDGVARAVRYGFRIVRWRLDQPH